ncbi:ABC transporter ATP-binding protein [Ferruginibacter sp. HRS2-29]|uniref:ABC transporter ATP-binding protein n=1 Tax=Ferruginibacter sp. HRS2-29 TaxID=2487334 RepID=UPI0020CE7CCE|nr:ABC transporter ATP-binding protein [Ferruginibacter sp. HRS2-29]MCP9752713.1 ABC transporter ATP-binding protein [Ferruginibacter sp. HRS2-29]
MHISANNLGKRYNREWIFRRFSYEFLPGNRYAITGPNGSGKSTLLQVLAGAVMHSEGHVVYTQDNKTIEHPFLQLTITAPYLELIEEMTAVEALDFHQTFKPLTKSIKDILETVGLSAAANKQIRYFSSGMKQRLKMAQAFFSRSNVLLLDEPTTNLDADGIALYLRLVNEHTNGKLVLVSSNDPHEYSFCEEVISIGNYKQNQ